MARFKARIPKTPHEHLERERAAAAIARVRRTGVSPSKAATLEDTKLGTMVKWFPNVVRKTDSGKYSVSSFDRRKIAQGVSYILPPELGGPETAFIPIGTVIDSRSLSKLERYMRDAMMFVENKAPYSAVTKWKGQGVTIGGVFVRFITEKDVLIQWANQLGPDDVIFGSG